jgi:hypothetical protein
MYLNRPRPRNGAALVFPRLRQPQGFFGMYGPSMLALGPFGPALAVLLTVLATVKTSM